MPELHFLVLFPFVLLHHECLRLQLLSPFATSAHDIETNEFTLALNVCKRKKKKKSIKIPFHVARSCFNPTIYSPLDACIGQALVPFYRQILPVLNIFYGKNVNLKHRIDFDRVRRLGDLIDQTLMVLERCGGKNAYINIKYVIPTYESYVNN